MSSKIVSPIEWLDARVSLLAKEKELTRLHDELAQQRMQLPGVRVDQPYVSCAQPTVLPQRFQCSRRCRSRMCASISRIGLYARTYFKRSVNSSQPAKLCAERWS